MTQNALNGLTDATHLASVALFAGKWEAILFVFIWLQTEMLYS